MWFHGFIISWNPSRNVLPPDLESLGVNDLDSPFPEKLGALRFSTTQALLLDLICELSDISTCEIFILCATKSNKQRPALSDKILPYLSTVDYVLYLAWQLCQSQHPGPVY